MATSAADTETPAGVEVALLDRDGVIVAVNEAWERFASDNDADPLRTGVGVSYLSACDSAAEDPQASAVAQAIRSAILGDLPAPMNIRIPCHAPTRQRFFDVLISSRTEGSGECLGATVTLSQAAEEIGSLEQGPISGPVPELGSTEARLRALLRANAAVASDLSLPVVLRHIVEAARVLVDARYAALGVVAADGTLSEFVHTGMDPATVDRIGELPQGNGLLGLLISDPHSVRVRDLEGDRAGVGFPDHHPPMHSFLGVPIRVRDQVFGNLYLTESSRGEFSAEDEQLVVALAASAGVAIENARLFSQGAQQRQWLASSTELTQRLFAGASGDALALVLRYATEGSAADFGRVVIPFDEQHGHVQAQIGSMGDLRQGDLVALENTLCGRILQEVKPMLVTDYDREFSELPQDPIVPTGVGAVAGVPLMAPDGTVLGALVVRRPPGVGPFDEHDLGLLESFGMHAGLVVALDGARAGRESLLMLAEHDRIAADLHDHVIQELFAIGMGLHGMAHLQQTPAQEQRLVGYVDSLDETVRRIRTTIFALKHRPAGSTSLRARLLDVVDDERAALGFAAHIDFSGSLDLGVPDAMADDVVAVVREALSNVARHARAGTVTVRVSLTGPQVEVLVTDDGVGIANPSRSSGLGNLRRRAETHRGTFEVWSPATGGTHLRWTAAVEMST